VFGIGAPELIFILVLALLIFGPKRLPQIGRTLGKGMAEFRRASTELQRAINTQIEEPEPPRRPAPAATQPAAAAHEPTALDQAAAPPAGVTAEPITPGAGRVGVEAALGPAEGSAGGDASARSEA
jgi:TatA/E family protein of Tat protein translocase